MLEESSPGCQVPSATDDSNERLQGGAGGSVGGGLGDPDGRVVGGGDGDDSGGGGVGSTLVSRVRAATASGSCFETFTRAALTTTGGCSTCGAWVGGATTAACCLSALFVLAFRRVSATTEQPPTSSTATVAPA